MTQALRDKIAEAARAARSDMSAFVREQVVNQAFAGDPELARNPRPAGRPPGSTKRKRGNGRSNGHS